MIAVVIPNVPGRDGELRRCVESHQDEAGTIHIVRGHSACGPAWDYGARLALDDPRVDHVLFSADDLVAIPGWSAAALSCTAAGELPAAILLDEKTGERWNPQDGAPGDYTGFSRIPFLPVDLLRRLLPIPPLHYYSDVWLGARAHDLGWKVRVAEGFDFVHLWAQPGRIQDSAADLAAFNAIMARGAL